MTFFLSNTQLKYLYYSKYVLKTFLKYLNFSLHLFQMESRLPKPKFTVKKAVDMNIKSNDNKIGKDGDNTSTSTSSINTKSTNLQENKLAVRKPLVRAKTLSTIVRPKDVTAVKRPAPTTTYGEVKRPLIKPTARAVIKPNNNGLVTNNRGNKVIQNNTDDKTDKLKKWDLRGRLAQTSDKLSVVQQKNKDIESKYTSLQEVVKNLEASETLYRTKAKELEVSNNALTNELQSLTEEASTLRERHESLTQRLKESEEMCKNLSSTLNEVQEKYKAQETLILEQTQQLITLKSDLESQKEINVGLEALSQSMDKERRILHNNIQELKGNIRVFCRVRPLTPREAEQKKV